jgi:hypothetical protein
LTENQDNIGIQELIVNVLAHERAIQSYVDRDKGEARIGIGFIYRFRCSEALRQALTMDLKTREEHYISEYMNNPRRFLRHVFARGIRSYISGITSSNLAPQTGIEVGKVVEAYTDKEIRLPYSAIGGERSYRVVLTARLDVYDSRNKEAVLVKPFENDMELSIRRRDLNEIATLEWIRRMSGIEIDKYRLLYISFDGRVREYVIDEVEPFEDLFNEILDKLVSGQLVLARHEKGRELCSRCEFRDKCRSATGLDGGGGEDSTSSAVNELLDPNLSLGDVEYHEDLRFQAYSRLLQAALKSEYEYVLRHAGRETDSFEAGGEIHLSVTDLLGCPIAYWLRRNMVYPPITTSTGLIRGSAIHLGIEDILYNAQKYYSVRNKYGLLEVEVEKSGERRLKIGSRMDNGVEYNVVLHGRADIWIAFAKPGGSRPIVYIIDIKTVSRKPSQDQVELYKKQVALYMNIFRSIEYDLRGGLLFIYPNAIEYVEVNEAVLDNELVEMIQDILEPDMNKVIQYCKYYMCDYASFCPIRRELSRVNK